MLMRVHSARAAADKGDFKEAASCVKKAAERALMLAKESTGSTRQQYMDTYRSLKTMLENFVKKANAQQAAPPVSQNTVSNGSNTPAAPVDADSNKPPVVNNDAPTPNNSVPSNDGAKPHRKPIEWTDSLSPRYLSDYIGQPMAVAAVKDLIKAAQIKGTAMPHIILYGSHGLGKTTFAKIIANEMKANFIEVNVSSIDVTEMISILKRLQPCDIIFIDEIHTLPLLVAESVLYSAMQDGKVTYMEGKGKFAKPNTIVLPPFTLIGATTEIGKLAKPFTQRAIQIRLEEYSDEVLGGLISNSFRKSGLQISSEDALYIAKRCRNNPRVANNTVRRISDKAIVRYDAMYHIGSADSVEKLAKYNITVTKKVIDEFFDENGIDEYGLEKADRELLRLIIERYDGGPVGLDTLSRAINEANNVLSQKYEAYLIKKGMLKIEPGGRVAMPLAYTVLGKPIPEKLKDKAESKGTNPDGSKYDKRKVIASKTVDELKAGKLEQLIVYPENAVESTQDLDVLFPGADKPCEDKTNHACELEIDFDEFKRTLLCDSFLESRFATSMAKIGYLKDIKAQCLELPYISTALSDKRYFPDFVIKDFKGRIAIIEMKNYEMMSYHLNIDKYDALREFCTRNGYGYSMIAKPMYGEKYMCAEDILRLAVDKQLEEHIFATIEANGKAGGVGAFTQADFNSYRVTHPDVNEMTVYSILYNNRQLKNADRSGSNLHIELA